LIQPKGQTLHSKKRFVTLICIVVGILHFVIGPDYHGPLQDFVHGYLIDILLPFCVYFLISLFNRIPHRWVIVLMVFGIGFTVETLQYFGFHIFGSTFDPLDYGMYALGAILTWIVDVLFFAKLNFHADK
jgi:hypothetical protein